MTKSPYEAPLKGFPEMSDIDELKARIGLGKNKVQTTRVPGGNYHSNRIDEMHAKAKRQARIFTIFFVIVALLGLALLISGVFVGVHFIKKYW